MHHNIFYILRAIVADSSGFAILQLLELSWKFFNNNAFVLQLLFKFGNDLIKFIDHFLVFLFLLFFLLELFL